MTHAQPDPTRDIDEPAQLEPDNSQRPEQKTTRFGIKLRLMLAFGAVAAMTVVASMVAWFSYANIETSFTRVSGESVPAMTRALGLAAGSARLSAAAPALVAADNEAERKARMGELQGEVSSIETLVRELAQTSRDQVTVARIEEAFARMAANLRATDAQVAERLAAKVARAAGATEVARLHAEILAKIAPLVDTASFDLAIGSEAATGGATRVINELIGEGVTVLRGALEVQAAGNLAAGLMSEAAAIENVALLNPLQERFTAVAVRLDEGLASLPETEEYAVVRDLSAQLIGSGRGENGIFEIRRQELRSEDRAALADRRSASLAAVRQVHQGFLVALAPLIDEADFNLVMGGEDASKQNAALIETLMNEGVAGLRAMLEIQAQINLAAGLLSQGANALEIVHLQPLGERFEAVAAGSAESLSALPEGDASNELRSLVEALIGFGKGENSLFRQRLAELEALAKAQAFLAENVAMARAMGEHVAALVAAAEQDMSNATADVTGALGTSRMILGAIAGTSLVIALLMAWLYVGRNLIGRLTKLAGAMRELAGGNLEVEIPAKGSDELADMAQTLFVFRNGLVEVENANKRTAQEREKAAEAQRQDMQRLADDFESSIKGVVDGVGTASTQMQSTAESMSATAEETNQQAAAVASASEQATANVQTVATATEEMSASIGEIGRQVEQSAAIAQRAVAEAEKTNVTVQGLAEAAEKIGAVVELISNIASQTNLLALNATIEAARAGDAGKGFAVVASEVKSLANQTAKATEEIGAQIAGMQSVAGAAVEAIGGIGKTITEVDEIAATIAAAVEEQGTATQDIARNVQEAARGTQEVSSNITGVSQGAEETGKAANQVLEAAGQLSHQSEDLRAAVDKFLADIRAA